jgi:probable F420-dependent oxidoreductase
MKFGATLFPTDTAIDPVRLAQELEARGFDSLVFPEHTHIPAAVTVNAVGAPLGEEYRRTLDPFVVLGAVAAATSRIKIGTGICLVTQRDPILLAKEVASVDYLSNGRMLFGIGAGWNRPEIENHGVPYARRWRVMRERIQAMKAIWANDEAEYHGDFVDFGPINSWPKPIQKPHPPIIIGADGPKGEEALLEYGDGWIPRPQDRFAPLAERMAAMNARMAERGRGPVPVWVFSAPLDAARLAEFERAGVDTCMFYVPSTGPDAALAALDRCQAVMRQLG